MIAMDNIVSHPLSAEGKFSELAAPTKAKKGGEKKKGGENYE
jgi:hypothetical protein